MTVDTGSLAQRHLIIMGIRGIPAAHGGFETFAERLAIYLVDRGWRVTVYCQGSPSGKREVDEWQGITRIKIPGKCKGSLGTIEFDIKATLDVLRVPGTILTLGYNTAFMCVLLAAKQRANLINMDGIEWKRAKYSGGAKAYLWLNEHIAAWSGTRLIADHPRIADHLAGRATRSKLVTIPYGAPEIRDADASLLAQFRVEPGRFLTIIARAEPENSILEIVRGFSLKRRGLKLLVLGKYAHDHAYQRKVMAAASDEVLFPGPVYEPDKVQALRFFSFAYFHGHQVGGTNPSLVEALGAGNPVIAHDNPFNRWVAGEAGLFFHDEADISAGIERLISDPNLRQSLADAARKQWADKFTWSAILEKYEQTLTSIGAIDGA